LHRSNSLKAVAACVLAVALGLSLSGCRSKATQENVGNSITVAGSTSVQPFAEILADDYLKSTGFTVNVQGGGSSAGAQAAITGVAQIGTLSRELSPDEAAVLTQYVIAHDAIAIVVNPANPLQSLTSDQVKAIFDGQITDWAQVGALRGRITVISREEGSGTRGAFDELLMKKAELTPRALVQDSNGSVKETVAQDSKAIGYISLGIVDERVRPLTIDGVVPSIETVTAKEYKLVRPFLFTTKGQPDAPTRAFIDYVMGPTGQKILADEGLVPGSSGQ
jgi:phosphate transport system substrate-binding protein